jgi:Na+/melibiose symporter-like transporter
MALAHAGATGRSEPPRLSLLVKILYSLGGTAVVAKTTLLSLLLLFYNQIIGLPAEWVSLALAVSLVIDAIWDPIFGQLSDDFRSPWGRRHPFMYASALPFAICWILLFHPPAGWSHESLFWWLLVLIVLSRVFISLYELPLTALHPELSRDYHDRTKLWSFRYVIGSVGGPFINWMGFALFLRPTPGHPIGQLNQAGYGAYAIATALISVAAILTATIGTHRLIPTLYVPPRAHRRVGQVFRQIAQTLLNRDFVSLILSGIFSGAVAGVTVGLGAYLNTFFWALPASKLATLSFSGLLAFPAAAIFAPWLSVKFGKKAATMALMTGTLVIGQAPVGLRMLGLMPPNGTALLFDLLFGDAVITGICTGGALLLIYSMISDVVEYAELKTGRRSEGLMMSSVTMLQKILSGVATIIPGLMLVAVGFPNKAMPGAVAPEILDHLAYLYLPTVAIGSVLSIACVQWYRIDQTGHEAVTAQLRIKAHHPAETT